MIMTRIVILAAGKGTRMNSELPKVLVPLNGRPMIKYLLEAVFASGVDNKPIVVASPDNKEIIKKELASYNLDYAIQDKQLGTGHAVACAQSSLEQDGFKPDKVIILYGDHPAIKAESIKKFSQSNTGAVTIMPTKLQNYDDWRHNFYHWGRIIRRQDGQIEGIVEFKDASEEIKKITEVNPGFMCFNYDWLFKNIHELKNNNSQGEYYLTDMVKIAFSEGLFIETIGIEAHEAMGVNSLEELKIAERLLK